MLKAYGLCFIKNIVSILLKRLVNALLKRMVSSFSCKKCFSYMHIIHVAFIYCYSVSFHCFFVKAHGWATSHSGIHPSSARQHFQTSSPQKPLGQLNWNFIWRLLRTWERKFVQVVLVTWKSKWVWSRKTTITHRRPTHGTMRKSHRTFQGTISVRQ